MRCVFPFLTMGGWGAMHVCQVCMSVAVRACVCGGGGGQVERCKSGGGPGRGHGQGAGPGAGARAAMQRPPRRAGNGNGNGNPPWPSAWPSASHLQRHERHLLPEHLLDHVLLLHLADAVPAPAPAAAVVQHQLHAWGRGHGQGQLAWWGGWGAGGERCGWHREQSEGKRRLVPCLRSPHFKACCTAPT